MADEDKNAEGGEKAAGGSKKMIIIIAIVVLLLVVGGIGAFLALGSSSGGDAHEGGDEELLEEGDLGELPGAILPLETFIVNLQVKGSFLKVNIQLEFFEPALPPTIENDIPKLRDAIIRTLSSKKAAEILTLEGKEQLREEVKDSVNESLGAEDVVRIYFTEFIIQ